jgi:hypothetical protein
MYTHAHPLTHSLTHSRTHLRTCFLLYHSRSLITNSLTHLLTHSVAAMCIMRGALLWLLVALHSLPHSATAPLTHSTTAPLTLPAITHQWRSERVRQHYNATGIPSQHPLSEDMLQRGMPALTPSQLHRLLPLVHSLSLQQREGERLLRVMREQDEEEKEKERVSERVAEGGSGSDSGSITSSGNVTARGRRRVSDRVSERVAEEVEWKRVRLMQRSNVTIASLGGSFARGTQCCVGYAWPHRVVEWLQRAYPLVHIIHLRYLKGSTNTLYGASIIRELLNTKHVDLLLMGYAINDEVIELFT